MAESQEVIEAREKTNDREYYFNIVETMPLLIEWANEGRLVRPACACITTAR